MLFSHHQMNMQLSAEFGLTFVRLPLKNQANIHNVNALRVDWSEIVFKPDDDEVTLYNDQDSKQLRNYNENISENLLKNIHKFI